MRRLALSAGILALCFLEPIANAQSHGKESTAKKQVIALHMEIVDPQEDNTLNEFAVSFRNTLWRNWLSVMPQSAMLGESGKVIVRFRIHRDRSEAARPPSVELSSGKNVKPLREAALEAIRDSTRKLHFPDKFTGSYIEFRAEFFYNQPAESVKQ